MVRLIRSSFPFAMTQPLHVLARPAARRLTIRVRRAITGVACLAATLPTLAAAQQVTAGSRGPAASAERWEQARFAWEGGDYVRALTALSAVLRAPDAATFRERIALLTGENWHTSLVAENARAPRWSPDGRYIAFERGTGASRVTQIVRATDAFEAVTEVAAGGVVFAPDGARVAFITGQGEGGALRVRALDGASGAADLAVLLPGLVPADVLIERDGSLLVVAAPTGETRTRLYRVRAGQSPLPLGRGDSVVADVVMSRDGGVVLHGVGGRSPLQQGTGRGFTRGPAREQFALLDLATGAERRFMGEGAVLSADGGTFAYITRADGENRVHVGATRGGAGDAEAAPVVHRTTDSLSTLALSPDGARVAFQQRPREDWELYTVSRAGGEPERITREIQHDLLPQWLSNDRLLAVMGEARHRRSHLYEQGVRTRLFHNNTVRTIAPEYEWVPSPDGRKLLIVAERDGDTVTPHRHLWCMDLTREVTVAELAARVDAQPRGGARACATPVRAPSPPSWPTCAARWAR